MTPPAGPHLHAKGSDHRLTRKPESHHPQPRPTRTPLLLCPGGAVHGLSIRAAKTGESKDHITRRPGTVLIDQLAPQDSSCSSLTCMGEAWHTALMSQNGAFQGQLLRKIPLTLPVHA